MADYELKDGGDRQEFSTGSVREPQGDKPRPDLISPIATQRHAVVMAAGAKKYGDRNWEKGQPSSRFRASLYRHLLAYDLGDRSEDHLAQARFNLDALMHFEGTEHDDLNEQTQRNDWSGWYHKGESGIEARVRQYGSHDHEWTPVTILEVDKLDSGLPYLVESVGAPGLAAWVSADRVRRTPNVS